MYLIFVSIISRAHPFRIPLKTEKEGEFARELRHLQSKPFKVKHILTNSVKKTGDAYQARRE